MLRLSSLLTLVVTLAPFLAAQPAADSALVAGIYADLARGDVEAVVGVLDYHVLWTEGAHSPQAGRHFGPGTVAFHVLRPQAAAGTIDVVDSISTERGRVVAVGTTSHTDPATGRPVIARFRHVWQLVEGRVVGVDRSTDGPDLSASDPCGTEPC